MSDATPLVLLKTIRQWITEGMSTVKFGIKWARNLDEFIHEFVPDAWSLIKEAVKESLSEALKKLGSLKNIIMEKCHDYEKLLRNMLVKVGTKTLIRAGAQLGLKQSAKFGAKAVFKAATNPLGVASDLTQAGLEIAGYEDTAKKVGAGGNIAGGALAGFAVGGPVGAGVGAVVGTGIWFVGEVVGGLF